MALAIGCLMFTTGLAIDYAVAVKAQLEITRASDAANLAAARTATDLASKGGNASIAQIAEAAKTFGERYFYANLDTSLFRVTKYQLSVTEKDGNWKATSISTAETVTMFSSLAGFDTMNVHGETSASIKAAYPVLDIAMCVDSTGSMTATLDAVKNNATSFYDRLSAELTAKGVKPFAHVRVRLSYFKDFGDANPGVWDLDPLINSEFFDLPDDNSDFLAFASPQVADGGNDLAESGLECMNEAIASKWTKVNDPIPGSVNKATDVYPLVIVWTDAPTHSIGFPNSVANPAYPSESKMPRNYADMLAKWNNGSVIDQNNKQLLFFGDPTKIDKDSSDNSAWLTIKEWPGFRVGGTLMEANTSMVEFIAAGIAKSARALAVTN